MVSLTNVISDLKKLDLFDIFVDIIIYYSNLQMVSLFEYNIHVKSDRPNIFNPPGGITVPLVKAERWVHVETKPPGGATVRVVKTERWVHVETKPPGGDTVPVVKAERWVHIDTKRPDGVNVPVVKAER